MCRAYEESATNLHPPHRTEAGGEMQGLRLDVENPESQLHPPDPESKSLSHFSGFPQPAVKGCEKSNEHHQNSPFYEAY